MCLVGGSFCPEIWVYQVSVEMLRQKQGLSNEHEGDLVLGAWKPLLCLVCVLAFLAAGCWWRWGATGWPVGSFWWDELALSGAAHAMREGMVPTVDFWAPLILPLYLKMYTENWVGYQSAYVLECLLQGGVVVALFAGLVGRQRLPASAYWVVALLALSVMAPFNIGSTTQAKLGTVVNACSYNRLGGGLIALVAMLPVVRRGSGRDYLLMVWLATVLVIAALLKITVLQISWMLVALWAALSGEKGWWRLLGGATALALATLLPFGSTFDWWQGYAAALAAMSELRASLLAERSQFYLTQVLDHRFELFVLVFAAFLVAVQSMLLRRSWVGPVVWSLLAGAAMCAYTVTNFGDSGLMPVVSVLWAIPLLLGDVGGAAQDQSLGRYVRLISRVLSGLFLILFVMYLGAILFWASWFDFKNHGRHSVVIDSQVEFLRNYHFDEADWRDRFNIRVNGGWGNYRRPSVYASYLVGVDEAAVFLSGYETDRRKSVYALDFPAYVFPLVAGYRVPKGTYPWVLYGHEMTIEHHPNPDRLFSDVDILMLPKCSLAAGNRRLLGALYRVWIEQHFEKVASLSCWDVHRKSNGGVN